MSKVLKAKGQRGSWFADVEGESLPCVHKYWWTDGKYYHDPNVRPNERQWIELIDAIKAKRRVILTEDRVIDGGSGFERTKYIAIFEVDDIDVGKTHLRFRFVRRLCEIK